MLAELSLDDTSIWSVKAREDQNSTILVLYLKILACSWNALARQEIGKNGSTYVARSNDG